MLLFEPLYQLYSQHAILAPFIIGIIGGIIGGVLTYIGQAVLEPYIEKPKIYIKSIEGPVFEIYKDSTGAIYEYIFEFVDVSVSNARKLDATVCKKPRLEIWIEKDRYTEATIVNPQEAHISVFNTDNAKIDGFGNINGPLRFRLPAHFRPTIGIEEGINDHTFIRGRLIIQPVGGKDVLKNVLFEDHAEHLKKELEDTYDKAYQSIKTANPKADDGQIRAMIRNEYGIEDITPKE